MLIKALILAGGQSRRFGTDKSQALLQGRPLIAHVIAALGDVPMAISGDVARYSGFGVPVLPDDDEFAGHGPLAGLCAGMAWACGADALITVPCDTPFLPPDLIARLLPSPCYARADGRDHFLVASWRPDTLGVLRVMLRAEGSRKVERFTRAVNARAEEFAGGGNLFANINRREDLDLLGGPKPCRPVVVI